jgi:hypothetical protein
MRELQLILSDDLTYAQTGERVPADETVVLAFDGKTRELDLTSEHAKELRDLIGPYLEAGHHPTPQASKPPPGVEREESSITVARARQQLIRDWADARGMRSPDGKRPVYRTESGGYYYSYRLMRQYEAHLASQGE